MRYIYKGHSIKIAWTVTKGLSSTPEDFSKARLAVFMKNDCNKYHFEAEASEAGVISLTIPADTLPEGIYGIEAIWAKNLYSIFGETDESKLAPAPPAPGGCRCGMEVGRHDACCPPVEPPHEGEGLGAWGDRCLDHSYRAGLFCITSDPSVALPACKDTVSLALKTSAVTYGYDGLSAYDIAVLRGYWTGDEESWVKSRLGVTLYGETGTSETHGMTQKAITDALTAILSRLSAVELGDLLQRLHPMNGEYVFSDGGKITSVTDKGDGVYELVIGTKETGDTLPFEVNDILYSIVNPLSEERYTSWMQVKVIDADTNTVTVVLYADKDVPGEKNYPPVAGYNISRKGTTEISAEGVISERSGSWLLSSEEGRVMFLENVVKPVLEDYNYSVILGKLPIFDSVSNLLVKGENDMGLMAKTIVCKQFFQYDWNGELVPNIVDRGVWSLTTAEGDTPYRYVSYKRKGADGKTVLAVLEQHTVQYNGCVWACISDKTTAVPTALSPGWRMVSGDTNYYMQFSIPNGTCVKVGDFDLELCAMVKYANADVTDILMSADGFEIEWTRDTGDAAADATWKPEYVGGKKNVIHIDRTDEHGTGVNFGFKYRTCTFTCRMYVPDESKTIVEGSLISNI